MTCGLWKSESVQISKICRQIEKTQLSETNWPGASFQGSEKSGPWFFVQAAALKFQVESGSYGGVSEEMRGKVVALAKEMGYELAKSSKEQVSTGNIGVLVANRYFVGSPFYATLYRSLVLSGTQSGVTCMMEIVSPEAGRDIVQPPLVSGRKVEALIFMGSFNHAYVQSVIECGLPFVLLDFSFQDIRITA